MKIIYLREEGEIGDVSSTEANINLPNNSAEMPKGEIPDTINTDVELPNNSTQISNNITNNIDVAGGELNRRLPPPDRSSYDYRIVPFYIPVGSKNIFRYRDNYLDYDGIIVRDIVDRNFRFKDGSYGIYCKYDGVLIKAGSRPTSRKNLILVSIEREGEIFTKRIKNTDRARKIVEKLINALYNYGEEKLLMLLIKYKFN